MAKKSNKAAGVAVAVGGVAALGLAAYALSQSKSAGQKEASQLLSSGGYGGGATGGYSDAFTDVTTPSTQPSISDTVADVLNKVVQTPQAQPTPIIINPPADNGYDDIIPLINAVDNPSDEKTDVKQGNSTSRGESVTIPNTAGNAYDAFFKQLVDDGEASYSNGGVYIPSSIGSNAKTSSSAAVEYNPFDFAPTKKQADYSSYNQGKTGGTANTPSRAQQEYQSNKVYDTGTKRSDSAGAQALSQSITSGTSPSNGKSSNAVESFGNFVSNTVQSTASAVGSFFGGLFGGK